MFGNAHMYMILDRVQVALTTSTAIPPFRHSAARWTVCTQLLHEKLGGHSSTLCTPRGIATLAARRIATEGSLEGS